MEYTIKEKEALALLKKTDFKNISKSDVVSMVSKLSELRPDVAKDIIAQFPQFVDLAKSMMVDYKDMLGQIIQSDDQSLNSVYTIAKDEVNTAKEGRTEFFDLAKQVHADISKCLDKDNLSAEERDSMLNKEIEVLKIASEKDSEIREQEKEILRTVDKKDSEKRQYNWALVGAASAAFAFVLSVGINLLGGDVNIKLPNKV